MSSNCPKTTFLKKKITQFYFSSACKLGPLADPDSRVSRVPLFALAKHVYLKGSTGFYRQNGRFGQKLGSSGR